MDFRVTTPYAWRIRQDLLSMVFLKAMCLPWHMILREERTVIRGEKAGAGLLSSQFLARRPIVVTQTSELHPCKYDSQKPKSPACRRGFLENSEQVKSFAGHDLLNNN